MSDIQEIAESQERQSGAQARFGLAVCGLTAALLPPGAVVSAFPPGAHKVPLCGAAVSRSEGGRPQHFHRIACAEQ